MVPLHFVKVCEAVLRECIQTDPILTYDRKYFSVMTQIFIHRESRDVSLHAWLSSTHHVFSRAATCHKRKHPTFILLCTAVEQLKTDSARHSH